MRCLRSGKYKESMLFAVSSSSFSFPSFFFFFSLHLKTFFETKIDFVQSLVVSKLFLIIRNFFWIVRTRYSTTWHRRKSKKISRKKKKRKKESMTFVIVLKMRNSSLFYFLEKLMIHAMTVFVSVRYRKCVVSLNILKMKSCE